MRGALYVVLWVVCRALCAVGCELRAMFVCCEGGCGMCTACCMLRVVWHVIYIYICLCLCPCPCPCPRLCLCLCLWCVVWCVLCAASVLRNVGCGLCHVLFCVVSMCVCARGVACGVHSMGLRCFCLCVHAHICIHVHILNYVYVHSSAIKKKKKKKKKRRRRRINKTWTPRFGRLQNDSFKHEGFLASGMYPIL